MNITGTIRDTVSPARLAIDTSYMGVLAYRDGEYRWPGDQVRRFRDASKLIFPITVTGAEPHIAQIADCEKGDLSPAGAADWAHERNQLHHDATVYTDLDGVPDLVDALGDEPCWLHIAWWKGRLVIPQLELPPHIKIGLVQYLSTTAYDQSQIVNPDWPAHPFTDLALW